MQPPAHPPCEISPPSFDDIYISARSRYSDEAWLTLAAINRTAAIYAEMRLMDKVAYRAAHGAVAKPARQKVDRQAPQPPGGRHASLGGPPQDQLSGI